MIFIRCCPECLAEITYRNKLSYLKANKNKTLCTLCRNKPKFKRCCPECNKEIIYKNKAKYDIACKNNKACCDCKIKNLVKNGFYKRSCIQCNKEIVYKSKRAYFNCKSLNTLCRSCAASKRRKGKPSNRRGCHLTDEQKHKISVSTILRHKKYTHPMLGKFHSENAKNKMKVAQSGKNNGMYGKKHSQESKLKMSASHFGTPGHLPSPEGLKSLRIKRIKEIENNKYNGYQLLPSYNKKACIFFDKLDKTLNWNGIYATKGMEYKINTLGYFVDYYEPNLNIVIEWDERRHYNIDDTLKLEDVHRQEEITQELKCKFFRIRESHFDEIQFINKMLLERNT